MKTWRILFLFCLFLGLLFISLKKPSLILAEEISLPLAYPGAIAIDGAPTPAEEEKSEEMDLKSLMNNYYYFRHLANQRMGWNYWGWAFGAIFPEEMETAKSALEEWQGRVADPLFQMKSLASDPVGYLANITGMDEWKEKFDETKEFLGNVWETGVVRKDGVAAACEIGNFAVEKQEAGPVASLLAGGAYTECLLNRTKEYYQKTQEKLIAEDPNYCVFQENYQGKDYCYKTWLEYWKVFHPQEVVFSMLTSVPRGLEAYNEAASRWQEKTKFGEFSNGGKYTVKEITSEDWQDAFEDMNWSPQKYEVTIFKSGQTPEMTPALVAVSPSSSPVPPKEKARIEGDTKVYLGDKLLLDIAEAPGGCSSMDEILYAPTEAYFLVIVWCFEGDNEIFLFKADGSEKKRITAKWDVVNYEEVEWAQDGQSFTYHRINSCCVEPERFGEKGPPVGMVRYDIATGEKTLVGPYTPPGQTQVSPSPVPPTDKIMTVEEFNQLPNPGGFYGCGFDESDPAKPITMELEITRRIEEELSEKFIANYRESGEELPLYATCPLYTFEGKDSTGTLELCVLRCDREYGQCVVPSKKLEVGKKYLLKGCRPYVGTGGPGPGPSMLGVREEWENAIIEK